MRHTEYTANQALAATAARKPDTHAPTRAESARHIARQHSKPAPIIPAWLLAAHVALCLVSFACIGALMAA